MKYLCFHCFNVFQYINNYQCPLNACWGQAYHVDSGIIETIRELNLKGYRTLCSCAGHVDESVPNTMIAFHIDIKSKLPDLPKNFVLEDDDENMIVIKRKYDTKLPGGILHIKILETLVNLHKWVMNLPKI